VNWTELARQEFYLPPIGEQRRIVCALSAFDEAVESLRCASAAQRASHAALLEQLFPLRRTQELCRSQRTECEGWLRLRELAVFQSGYPFESTGFVATGDRLLRGSNVGVGAINWPPDDTRYWPIERRGDVAHYVLREGDIVIAMDRPFINDGFKAARVSCVDLPALLLQRVGRFVAESAGSAAVLWAFVQSRAFQWQLSSGIEGTNVPHISKSQIESTWLPREVFEAGAVLGALDASEKCAKGLRVRAEQLLEHRCRVLGAAL
jgi:type I restriction enzyme S subunit